MADHTSSQMSDRQREEAMDLAEREATYRNAFEQAPIGIALVSPEGRWLKVNASLCRIVGYREEELLRLTFQDITHPEDLDTDLSYVQEMLEGKRDFYKMEKRYFHKAGHVIWIELTVTLQLNEDGSPKYFISQINDITSRKQMELELREREAVLQKLTDDTPAMLWMSDAELQCYHFNKSSLQFTGRTIEEELGLGWLQAVHPEDRAQCLKTCELEFARGQPFKMIYRLRRHDGVYRDIEDSGSPRFDASGKLMGYIGVCTDITERLNSEKELRKALNTAREADLAKSTFLATMSHEIRTPLHSVIGFAQLLLDSGINPQHAHLVAPILSGGEMLLAVINDILDYSKIEAGQVELERVEFSLPKCVHEVSALSSAKAAEKALQFTCVVEPDVPEWVIGDIHRLRQVLANLLSNAVKFTSSGEVELHVSTKGYKRGLHLIHFKVRDTGIGFPEDKLSQLFEPFRQLDTSTTRTFGGTGLGLAISKRLIHAMGGTLNAESVSGEGTTFHLLLQFLGTTHRVGRSTNRPSIAPPTASLRTLSTLSPQAQSLKVLVAEDNETNQRLITQLLLRLGLQAPHLVNHGEAAVAAVAANQFDLVLMDCQMPVMDGYEATQKIRQAERGSERLAIIALTAAALPGDREKALKAGMDDYLTKPIRSEAFAELLEQIAQELSPSV